MNQQYILSLDQGTTSSRTLLVNNKGVIKGISQQEFQQIYPKHGWVEHDALEILETQLATLEKVITESNINPKDIKGIGITNQRETTVVWDKTTGKPIYNAIVWQDKRTANTCEDLKKQELEEHVRQTTGLVIDSYFSATKIHWILENVEDARQLAEKGELLFGTIDTWLLWHMTKGQVHATDYSNASRTMLFDINTLEWDDTLLAALNIPKSMLPEVKPSGYVFGEFEFKNVKIPIAGIAGDQQAALFGQACFKKGTAKNTYGTGCFMLMNTGKKPKFSTKGLLTTIAWGINGKVYYALEGSVFIAGAAIQWLRDELSIIKDSAETEVLANSITEENPVYVVPAFAGLGAPYWDMYAKGAIFGLTRDTGKAHIAKATLESLAYQTKDILEAMQQDAQLELKNLRVDGGACANNYLMQFQADILDTKVQRPEVTESTAMGAAYLAGIAIGLWKQNDIKHSKTLNKVFSPTFSESTINTLYSGWQKAVQRTFNWSKPDDT